jgi:hypothetical protein
MGESLDRRSCREPNGAHISQGEAASSFPVPLMTIDHTISATVAVVSGAASLAIQAVTTPMVLPIVALAVTSLSMVIGGAVAYGMMKKSTMMLEKDLRHLSGQMVELIGRISTIEGELKARNQSSR